MYLQERKRVLVDAVGYQLQVGSWFGGARWSWNVSLGGVEMQGSASPTMPLDFTMFTIRDIVIKVLILLTDFVVLGIEHLEMNVLYSLDFPILDPLQNSTLKTPALDYTEKCRICTYSMLIFISPSLVSVMPCKPIRLGPSDGVIDTLPPLFDLSPLAEVPLGGSFVGFADPQRSRPAGDCDSMGLLVTLRPGDTARRLMEYSSRSSSRRRLLDFFNPSAAVKGARGCGVDERDIAPGCTNPSDAAVVVPEGRDVDPDETVGESMLMSSLTAEDPARGKDGGGGV